MRSPPCPISLPDAFAARRAAVPGLPRSPAPPLRIFLPPPPSASRAFCRRSPRIFRPSRPCPEQPFPRCGIIPCLSFFSAGQAEQLLPRQGLRQHIRATRAAAPCVPARNSPAHIRLHHAAAGRVPSRIFCRRLRPLRPLSRLFRNSPAGTGAGFREKLRLPPPPPRRGAGIARIGRAGSIEPI